MKICLNSYDPFIFTAVGRKACEKYGLSPLIDGPCRREPDFESEYLSITALHRKGNLRRGEERAILSFTSCARTGSLSSLEVPMRAIGKATAYANTSL